jgi:hypothetical protein
MICTLLVRYLIQDYYTFNYLEVKYGPITIYLGELIESLVGNVGDVCQSSEYSVQMSMTLLPHIHT